MSALWGAIVGILVFCIICVIWAKYSKSKIEGFASGKTPTDVATKIKTSINDLSDILNRAKYRNAYEDIIVECETWATESQLNLLASGVIGVGTLDDSAEHIKRFNDLKLFKTKLNDLMNDLDAT